jgi:Fe(3+) dicitrate transport protein
VGQESGQVDTLRSKVLKSITVKGYRDLQPYLPDVKGTTLFAGKKTNVVSVSGGQSNVAQNVGRMIFAKIPGINIWDMDGAGTQMNIGSRGTDAHRAIEMNMRQNGYNTNSDIIGYPENHYTVPMQAVDRVELIRGSASLQFGSQFGGMMNYVMKDADTSRIFSIENEQTFGSNGFFNSFIAAGGAKGKVSYYAYYDNRHGDGWRPNSAFNYQAVYGNIRYNFSEKGSLEFQFSRMDYRQQIAGGLTDAQFEEDPRQSNRTRNFFSPKINIPALIFSYSFTPNTRLEVTTNALWGERSSIQFINMPDVKDTINTSIGSYNPRQVDRDFYTGFTTEVRLLHRYEIGKIQNTIAAGLRYYNSTTKRRQKGKGSAGSDFDFSLIAPYGIDLRFHTLNYAVFVENIFQLSDRFSVTPGFRYEVINSKETGVIDNASFPVSYNGERNFPLLGIGLQFQVNPTSQVYANLSQAYRPYLYAYITPADQIGQIDPHLKDSKGYDFDFGFRGNYGDRFSFDLNVFNLYYGDRIGKLTLQDENNINYLFTTNAGNSIARGVELYLSLSLLRSFYGHGDTEIRLFTAMGYTHARFLDGQITTGGENVSLEGNHVENSPDWVNRAGVEYMYKGITSTLMISYVSNQYSDANNTVFNPVGATGLVPSYTLWDWALKWNFLSNFSFGAGINNLGDVRYFSRRINMYPGPGILPGDGRTFYLSLGVNL